MSAALNGTSIALSFISTIFFIIGCAGYAEDKSTVMNTAWIVSSKDGVDFYYGLQKAFVHFDGFGFDFNDSVNYGGGDCFEDWCDTCRSDGQGAVGLTIIALIFTVVTLSFSGALIASKNRSTQICNVLMAFFAAFSSLVGVALFMSECFNAVNDSGTSDDDYDDDYDDDGGISLLNLKWGPGAIVTIVGMLLMWIVLVLQIAAVATSA